MEYRFTARATRELECLQDIRRDKAGEASAHRLTNTIREACERLQQFPMMGRLLEREGQTVRFVTTADAVLTYDERNGRIVITRVIAKGENWR